MVDRVIEGVGKVEERAKEECVDVNRSKLQVCHGQVREVW